MANKNSDEELNLLREEAKKLGIDVDNIDDVSDGDNLPLSPDVKDNIFKFFRDVLVKKESTRIGNLRDEEIGKVKKSVRALNNISSYARIEGLDIVADYIKEKSYTVTETSMSRKGWFLALAVTQIKKEHKSSGSTAAQSKKFSFFGKPKVASEEENG